eukprot:s325_g5.t1
MLNKEEVIMEWGAGIWAGSETSHTLDAMKISSARLKKGRFHSVWSPPVAKHSASAGALRGKATGTCIISHLKPKPYPADLSLLAEQSSRLTECLFDVGRGTHMYVASVYGPTQTNTTFHDPGAILHQLCSEAFDHALAFKGPAMILGDFNVCIEDVPRWQALVRAGWIDAAAFDASRRNMQPNCTSKDKARKSFIMINAQLVPALEWCDTIEAFEFDSHPLLAANLNIDVIMQPICKWWLPATTDRFFFDDHLMTENAQECVEERQDLFKRAMERQDVEEATRQFTLAYESCLAKSCVDVVGCKAQLPKRCLGRGHKNVKRLVQPSAPVLKHARDGHFNLDVCQPSSIIRNQTKQVRRLQSLESQLHAANKSGNLRAQVACEDLWNGVLHARGFVPSFQEYIICHFGIFVPLACPGVEYVHYLIGVLKAHLQSTTTEIRKTQRFARECRVVRDIQKGGPQAYLSVRDPCSPAFQAIDQILTVQIVPQKWTKQGRNRLKFAGSLDGFDFQFPVLFQGQECFILGVDGHFVLLDRFVKWKCPHDWSLTQRRVISDHAHMQKLTGEAWSQMWKREPDDDDLSNWPEAMSSLENLRDFPTLAFQPLEISEWKRHAACTSHKSARGSCAFTTRELSSMPDMLVVWLLDILTAIERGLFHWPSTWMIARVVMLGKTAERPTCPLQTRPITIASRIYRNWARYRSMQIMAHFKTFLPAQIAGTVAGVSADMLSAIILLQVEKALCDGKPRLGITIDLQKCFNQIPRIPITAAMRKMGVPIQYVTALNSMFSQLRRLLELSGEVGDLWSSTTGVPEGCAMSLVAMISLTAWVAEHVDSHVQSDEVECVAYADNWAVLTNTFEQLQNGINALSHIVGHLKMKISTDKSWTWSTHRQTRQSLQHLRLDGNSVPTKLVANELGCDVSYCRKTTKKVAQKRIGKAVRVLHRIGKKKLPKRFKVTMTNQLSASVVGYGSELAYQTPSELRVIRTAACRAIGRSRSGNNAFLALHVTDGLTDVSLALLLRKVQHRPKFDAECLDIPAFHVAIGKDLNTTKIDALNLATGKHVTNDALVHYAKGAKSDKCPLCNQKDGRYHRVWDCVANQAARDARPALFEWLSNQLDVVSAWGVLPLDLTWIDWRFAQYAQLRPIACPTSFSEQSVDVFTDGSAIGQGVCGLTVAAAAYVRCDGYRILASCAEPLPGNDHSSYRAEIWGVLLALRDHRKVKIFTDCASVVDVMTTIFSALRAQSSPIFHDHADLWNLVWSAMQERNEGDVLVFKVRAHQNPKSISDPVERWKATMNNKADKLAKTCLRDTWGDDLHDIVEVLKERESDIDRLKEFHGFWHEINEKALELYRKDISDRCPTIPAHVIRFNPQNAVKMSCSASEQAFETCRFSEEFARRVVSYFDDLEWDYTQPDVSCLELYAPKPAHEVFDAGRFGRWLRMMLVSFYTDEEAVVAELLFQRVMSIFYMSGGYSNGHAPKARR